MSILAFRKFTLLNQILGKLSPEEGNIQFIKQISKVRVTSFKKKAAFSLDPLTVESAKKGVGSNGVRTCRIFDLEFIIFDWM